jgi:signal transduction histidine kinase
MAVIDDLLDFSKIEAGMVQISAEPFSLAQNVQAATAPWRPAADAKGVAFDVVVDGNDVVVGDPLRLRQVLSNLVDNAVKFTSAGVISVSVGADGDSTRFEVSDTGIGIDLDGQARLFEPFVQVDGSTTREYGGTGLGLAICRQLVGLMSGEIGVVSEPGHGSTFWFTVPLQQEPARALASEPLPV